MLHGPVAVTAAIGLAALAGCAGETASIGAAFVPVLDQPPEPIHALDVLFVIDDSASMQDQQDALIASAQQALFDQLATQTDGLPDLRVGVISTTVSLDVDGLTCTDDAPDGQLRHTPRVEGCAAPRDPWIEDIDDGAGGRIRNYDGTLGDAFGCIAALGTSGCGFEHPLEAMRRALDGSQPGNAGFLRDDALLLVVILSDEDDCSAFDPAVFSPTDASIDSPLGPLHSFRCFEFGVVCDDDDPRTPGGKDGCVPREDSPFLSPVAGYVEFLRGLKADPSMVMVAGIFGDAGPIEVMPDPTRAPEVTLASLCPGGADAYPAVRLDAFAEAFPCRYVLAPICDADMAAHLVRIASTTAGVLAARACLLGDLPASPSCRASAEIPGGARRGLAVCAHAGDAGCVTIAADEARCGYTPSRLAADAPAGLLRADEHLVVECALDDRAP
ncbi:MAG: VWA domain-containing protein [Kofleriaceae bacterium]|nr:VWA domain-containing protein [Myxococcales bacterium]MCB9562567.1 VWA domain-containing protein [Kofleriaceae bacterium]